MISIDDLLYKIDQRQNKVSTNANQQISVEDKVLALREAQIILVKMKVDPEEIRKLGFEGSRRRYQDLQFLIENPEDHSLTPVLSDVYLNKYITNITSLSPEFMFYIDSYMIADKGNCKNRIVWCDTELIKHSDISLLLQNINYKPSFEYQQTLADISTDELHYYTDGTFTPKKVYVSYIRYPKNMNPEGFIEIDGTTSAKQDCELEAYLEDELLDITCMNLGIYTENTSAVQGAQLQMQNK
jgi:hypothetical protein